MVIIDRFSFAGLPLRLPSVSDGVIASSMAAIRASDMAAYSFRSSIGVWLMGHSAAS